MIPLKQKQDGTMKPLTKEEREDLRIFTTHWTEANLFRRMFQQLESVEAERDELRAKAAERTTLRKEIGPAFTVALSRERAFLLAERADLRKRLERIASYAADLAIQAKVYGCLGCADDFSKLATMARGEEPNE